MKQVMATPEAVDDAASVIEAMADNQPVNEGEILAADVTEIIDEGAIIAAETVMLDEPITDIMPNWHVERGSTLRGVLESWGRDSGWVIVWDSDYD